MIKLSLSLSLFATVLALSVSPVTVAVAETPKAMKYGDVLTGPLTAMRVRVKGKHVETFQLTTAARKLPPPSGLCDLTTGPETFQLIDATESQTAQLHGLIGTNVSVRVSEVRCAAEAGQMSEAVVTKWSIVGSKPAAAEAAN